MQTANEAWVKLLEEVIANGKSVGPRGHHTLEVLGMRSSFCMQFPVITITKRKLGYRFMCAEAAWILSGDNRSSSLQEFSPKAVSFSDEGLFLAGAYGPKIVAQLPYIIQALSKDRYTRQAVINIWRESPHPSKDIPCTLSCQFLLRDRDDGQGLELHTNLVMRSSDAWLGVPYDWFNFTMLSWYVLQLYAKVTGDLHSLGRLNFFAGSSHLYVHNLAIAKEIIADDEKFTSQLTAHCMELPVLYPTKEVDIVEHLWALARRAPNYEGFLSTEMKVHYEAK